MNKTLYALLLLLLAAPAAATQSIPSGQQGGPATLEDVYPYRPACRQLVPVTSRANPSFNAWGPVIEGKHQNWYGLKNDLSIEAAFSALDSLGFCAAGGSMVPWEEVSDSPQGATQVDASMSPIERKLASAKAGHSPEQDNSGIGVIALFLAVGVGAWSYRKDMEGADDYIRISQSPASSFQQQPNLNRSAIKPHQNTSFSDQGDSVLMQNASNSDQSTSFMDQSASDFDQFDGLTIDLGEFKSPAVNPAALMADRKRSTLITARPRVGKSMTLAMAWPAVQAQGYTVWILQPKYHAKERHYWNGAHNICGFMIEELQQYSDEKSRNNAKTRLAEKLTKFLQEWRSLGSETLLVIDELRMLKQLLPEWYSDFFVNFMIVEMSSGETANRIFWCVTQSSVCKDIGLSGGDRSTFDLFSIQTPDSDEHYKSLRRSFTGLPRLESNLFQDSESPKNAVFYHSALNQWTPMVHYSAPPKAGNGSVTKSVTTGNAVTNSVTESVTDAALAYTAVEANLLLKIATTCNLPLPALLAALEGVKAGNGKTKIIKEILGMQGRDFNQGAEIYDQLETVVNTAN